MTLILGRSLVVVTVSSLVTVISLILSLYIVEGNKVEQNLFCKYAEHRLTVGKSISFKEVSGLKVCSLHCSFYNCSAASYQAATEQCIVATNTDPLMSCQVGNDVASTLLVPKKQMHGACPVLSLRGNGTSSNGEIVTVTLGVDHVSYGTAFSDESYYEAYGDITALRFYSGNFYTQLSGMEVRYGNVWAPLRGSACDANPVQELTLVEGQFINKIVHEGGEITQDVALYDSCGEELIDVGRRHIDVNTRMFEGKLLFFAGKDFHWGYYDSSCDSFTRMTFQLENSTISAPYNVF